jgi:glycosyltransferase involved in cell wall biosynthesis
MMSVQADNFKVSALTRCEKASDVVIVNDYAHVNGGAAQVALSSAIALAERGRRVTLLAAVGPISQELEKAGVRVALTNQYDIKSDPIRVRAATQGIWNPRASASMREILVHCDPGQTIVHVHGWGKALSISSIHAAVEAHFPVVITLHDYLYACPSGGFFNFQRKEICKLRPFSVACLKENCDRDGYPQKLWRSVRGEVQNQFGFRRQGVRHFITLSEISEAVLRPFLPPDAAVYRVPNPIDVIQEEPVDVSRNMQFVSVGRLSAEKGLGLLAQAAKELSCEVTFVGEGPSRKEINSIYPEARITGWQSRHIVTQYLRSARALVFPSLWYEAQPLAVLEAAALGIPAIVPDQCAAREMVEPDVTGLWFRSGDSSDLREKVATLQDPIVAERMGRAAYERYWKHPLTMERHLASLEACYRSVLDSRIPRPCEEQAALISRGSIA